MANTTEYERIFNMSIPERREILKNKDANFKKEYFTYDNRERARMRRDKNKTENPKEDYKISHDPILNSNHIIFNEKISDMFKTAKINAEKNSIDIVSQIIAPNPPNPPTPPNPPKLPTLPIIKEKDDAETFFKSTIYADTIISKNYITDDGEDGVLNGGDISNIKNYNIKMPVEHLKDIYIKMPRDNTKSSLIIDGEYCYIFFN
jgi:hypothetical protein